MNFLNLKYFLVAAEELNFTKAAKRLFISQQSLSNHIMKLEEYYKVTLFDRNPPLTLTVAGSCLVKRAKEILNIKSQTDKEIHDIKDFRSGQITIGVTHARGTVILTSILPIYHETFPSIQLHLFEGNSETIEEALHEGKVDLIVGFTPLDISDVETVPLFEENFFLIVPKKVLMEQFPDTFEEVSEKLIKAVDFELIKNCPFILMDPNTKVGTFSSSVFNKAGISPHILLQTKNIETMLALCREGMGIIFCPEIFITKSPAFSEPNVLSKIQICPLDNQNARTNIAISYLKNKYVTQAAKKFITIACENMRRLPSGGD